MYLDAQGNVIEDASTVGYKAIGVPGSVAGMVYAEKKYGKLSLQQVMAPAIKLAEEGFALAAEDARDLREDKPLGQFAESKRIFQRDGNFYKAGEVLKQPDLARTLKRIAASPDDFYRGDLARELAAAMQKGGGLITAKDLGELRSEGTRSGAGNLSRVRDHQRAAAIVGRDYDDRNPQHSGRLQLG